MDGFIKTDELVKKVGVGKSALRKYMQLGLIPRATVLRKGVGNTTSWYPTETLDKIKKIIHFKDQGKTLKWMSENPSQMKVSSKTEKQVSINWLEVSGKESGKLFAQTFMDYVNSSLPSIDKEAIDEILKGHRTLQQYVFDFCLDFIREIAKIEYYDQRNMVAVESARDIMTQTADLTEKLTRIEEEIVVFLKEKAVKKYSDSSFKSFETSYSDLEEGVDVLPEGVCQIVRDNILKEFKK